MMTGNSMLARGAKLLSLAVVAFGVLGSPQALKADAYGYWPLNDGDGDVARNEVPGGAEGFIHDWDVGGLADDGSVWVNDPVRGTVLGLAGTTAWVDAGFIPRMTLENDFSWAFWRGYRPSNPRRITTSFLAIAGGQTELTHLRESSSNSRPTVLSIT